MQKYGKVIYKFGGDHVKGHHKEIHINNKVINYTHIENGSNTICFMFSGSGYSYHHPLFYYATMVMLENRIDVVQVHYSFKENLSNYTIEEITKILMAEIDPILSEVLRLGQYNQTIFLGKSLGSTPIVLDLMKREQFLSSKMILLTPLLKFEAIFDALLHCSHQQMMIIGDLDPHYNASQIEQLRDKEQRVHVIPNANHSLDIVGFKTTESVRVLAEVMEHIQDIIDLD